MIWKIAEYTVREGEVAHVLDLVERFVAEVRRKEPDTFYAAWQSTDSSTGFVHLMCFEDEAAEQRHRDAAYTEEFVSDLYPRCETEPSFRSLQPVGSG